MLASVSVCCLGSSGESSSVLPAGLVPCYRSGTSRLRSTWLVQTLRVQRVGPAMRLWHHRYLDRLCRHGRLSVCQFTLSVLCVSMLCLCTLSEPAGHSTNAVVTCEIKLFQKYFDLCRRPSEIILFQHVETCLKLFQNYFRGLLQLMNIFQHV